MVDKIGRKGINSTFVGLGVVAAVGLLATGAMWAGSDHDVSVTSPSETTSKTVQPQQPSLSSSAPSAPAHDDTLSGSQLAPSDSSTVSGRDSVPDQKEKQEQQGTKSSDETELRDGSQVYIIKSGDTLSGISASFGVSVDRIAQANNIVDVNRIYAGSALVIPES